MQGFANAFDWGGQRREWEGIAGADGANAGVLLSTSSYSRFAARCSYLLLRWPGGRGRCLSNFGQLPGPDQLMSVSHAPRLALGRLLCTEERVPDCRRSRS